MNLHKKLALFHFLKLSNIHIPTCIVTLNSFAPFSSNLTRRETALPFPLADYLIKKHGFSKDSILPVCAQLGHVRSHKEADATVSYFKECGFSQTQIEEMLKRSPRILIASVDKTLKRKLKIFQDLGLSDARLTNLISNDPGILWRGEERLCHLIEFLKLVLETDDKVYRAIKNSGWLLKTDLKKTLLPLTNYMQSCGITLSQIAKLIMNFPRVLLLNPDWVKSVIQRVDELGFSRDASLYVHAIGVMSSLTKEKWEEKIKLFQSFGWSEKDVITAFKRAPHVLLVSEEKIRCAMEFYLNTLKFDGPYMILHPTLLMFSFEGRVVPRHRVVEHLRSKRLLRKSPSFSTVCHLTEKSFLIIYQVEPFRISVILRIGEERKVVV
ncbi:uncharacterized protein LOC18427339 isoform X2 [Amborella trichopoda]|uniref:uncharacterized protein LOC18427339 isoform X2 n=1 Tax=Amborella trichopoda TaxID=13333 RepID=UPI0005D34127|nr:uncharacterized protein LOC18427339 isoform X2 [Amborella trichopoda]|eukprot:XP_011620832.1 uncharacterized protein LOC18427339 isoform X2 [Amborella trichopoda]